MYPVYDFEKELVIQKIQSMPCYFSFAELKQNIAIHPIKLRKILAILKNEGIIEKYSNKKWRRI